MHPQQGTAVRESAPDPGRSEAESDFWEFVHCSRCFLPVSNPEARNVPFWLTECGHVLCNTHISPDQSCSTCSSQNIQLVPLQRQMPQPMGSWLAPLPQAIESLAIATRFQQESTMSFARFYKRKYLQSKALIDRMKAQLNSQEHQSMEGLRQEVAQLKLELARSRRENASEMGDTLNSNGKRRLVNSTPSRHQIISPESMAATPLRPQRLTLPKDLEPPRFASASRTASVAGGSSERGGRRPGSTLNVNSLGRFAYTAGQTPQPRATSSSAQNQFRSQQSRQPFYGDQIQTVQSAPQMLPPQFVDAGTRGQIFIPPATPSHSSRMQYDPGTHGNTRIPQTPSYQNSSYALGNTPSTSGPIAGPASAYSHRNSTFDRAPPPRAFGYQTPQQQNMPPIEYPQPKRPTNIETLSSNLTLTGSSKRSTNATPFINREYANNHQIAQQAHGQRLSSGFRPSLPSGNVGGQVEEGQRMKFTPRK